MQTFDEVSRAMIEDHIIGGYETPPVLWRDIRYNEPNGRLIAVRTDRGIYLHPMMDRAGHALPWSQQQDRWTDGQFQFEEVREWVRLM